MNTLRKKGAKRILSCPVHGTLALEPLKNGSRKSKNPSGNPKRFYNVHRDPIKVPQSVLGTFSGSFENHKGFHIQDKQRTLLAPVFLRLILQIHLYFIEIQHTVLIFLIKKVFLLSIPQ